MLDIDPRAETENLPGVYRRVAADRLARIAEVEDFDPRIRPSTNTDTRWHNDYTPKLSAANRKLFNDSSPATKQARREADSIRAGAPIRIPVRQFPFDEYPDAANIPFMGRRGDVPGTSEERDELAWLVWIWPNDDVTIGQTIGQREEQAQLVAEGYRQGEVDENGDYWPLGIDLTDGKLKRLGPTN